MNLRDTMARRINDLVQKGRVSDKLRKCEIESGKKEEREREKNILREWVR